MPCIFCQCLGRGEIEKSCPLPIDCTGKVTFLAPFRVDPKPKGSEALKRPRWQSEVTLFIPWFLPQWGFGEDLWNWASVRQGSHRTFLPHFPWQDKGSHQSTGELSGCRINLPWAYREKRGHISPLRDIVQQEGKQQGEKRLVKAQTWKLLPAFQFF